MVEEGGVEGGRGNAFDEGGERDGIGGGKVGGGWGVGEKEGVLKLNQTRKLPKVRTTLLSVTEGSSM